jgi:hypothetical protein
VSSDEKLAEMIETMPVLARGDSEAAEPIFSEVEQALPTIASAYPPLMKRVLAMLGVCKRLVVVRKEAEA